MATIPYSDLKVLEKFVRSEPLNTDEQAIFDAIDPAIVLLYTPNDPYPAAAGPPINTDGGIPDEQFREGPWPELDPKAQRPDPTRGPGLK